MSEGLLPIVFKFTNFGILVGILYKYGSKPFKGYLQSRHSAVKNAVEEAENLLRKAQEMKAAYEGRLAGLQGEIETFRKSALDQIEQERSRILGEATEFAARIREQATLAYEQEMKEAMARVRADIAARTIASAEKAVKDMFKKEDHDRLVEEFVEQVRRLP
jgi:F-type H+-transporting ATPase subunit b